MQKEDKFLIKAMGAGACGVGAGIIFWATSIIEGGFTKGCMIASGVIAALVSVGTFVGAIKELNETM